MLKAVRDSLLLSDPCLARLIFASRSLLGLIAVALVVWALADSFEQDLSGVMLGVVSAQFTLLLARQPERKSRIQSALIMIPGYWLGLVLIHGIAEQPAYQVVVLPLMIGLGFWLQNGRSRLATLVMAAAWIFLFTVYFQAQGGSLLWHLVAVSVSVPVMMAVRFWIWSEDRPVSRFVTLRSHQLILIRAAEKAGGQNHRADVLGELHKAMVPVVRGLSSHPDIDEALRDALLDQRRAVEVELLRDPARGPAIARVLAENPEADSTEVSPRLAALKNIPKPRQDDSASRIETSQPTSAAVSHRRSLQVLVAVLPAALAGFFISDERWPWAVLVAMFMFFGTESSGRMLSKGVHNVIGVVLGVALAIALSHLLPQVFWFDLIAMIVLAFFAYYLIPVNYAAGMTAVTALIGQALVLGGGDIAVQLQLRATEVLAGAACGLFAGLCVMPERASDNVRNACARVLRDVASIIAPDQPGVTPAQLRGGLALAYGAADFGRLAGLLIDGKSMRSALIELAQLQYLAEVFRRLQARSEVGIPAYCLHELADRCHLVAELVVNRKQQELPPISWPEDPAPEFGVLAAMDASVQAIAREG